MSPSATEKRPYLRSLMPFQSPRKATNDISTVQIQHMPHLSNSLDILFTYAKLLSNV